ncbi:MAG: hypothetical protein KAH21_05485 [Spirochaetaceae bacterium]|nr:hypothetical protein [Spirochaetaceae bacterium]
MSKTTIPVFIIKPGILKTDRRLVVINHTVKPVLRTLLFVLTLICTTSAIGAQTADDLFEKGLESFKWQKAEEASLFFKQAADADPGRDMYLLYLGITYHQTGKLQDAENTYSKGIDLNGGERDRLLLNRGNLRRVLSNYDGASSDYSVLINAQGPLSSSALLNRANMELNQSSFLLAVDDYSRYLVLEPESPQRDTIEELINLLTSRLANDAAAAALAVEQARLEEERRLAEEAALAEEEARRAALMEEALQSLSNSGEDTSSISAGSENIREDFEDSALED